MFLNIRIGTLVKQIFHDGLVSQLDRPGEWRAVLVIFDINLQSTFQQSFQNIVKAEVDDKMELGDPLWSPYRTASTGGRKRKVLNTRRQLVAALQ